METYIIKSTYTIDYYVVNIYSLVCEIIWQSLNIQPNVII